MSLGVGVKLYFFTRVFSLFHETSKYGFEERSDNELKADYLNDWTEYSEWKNKKEQKRTHNNGYYPLLKPLEKLNLLIEILKNTLLHSTY